MWRYGKGVQRQFDQAQMAVYQASALASIEETSKGVVITALKAVVEQNVLTKLTEGEPVDANDIRLMNAVANMIRASVLHQRRVDEIQARQQEPKAQQQKGLSEEAYYAMRNILLGKSFAQMHQSASAATGPMPDEFESQRKVERDIDPEATAPMPRPDNGTGVADSIQTEAAESAHNSGGDASVAMPGEAELSATNAEAAGDDAAQPNSPETGSPQAKAWIWPTLILPGPKYQDDARQSPNPTPEAARD